MSFVRETGIDLDELFGRRRDIESWEGHVQSAMMCEMRRRPHPRWFDAASGAALPSRLHTSPEIKPWAVELCATRSSALECFRQTFAMAEKLLMEQGRRGFFLARMDGLYLSARYAMQTWSDAWLLWLIHRVGTSITSYSTQQALLTASASWMTSKLLGCKEVDAEAAFKSGFTKDLSIASLKDILALECRRLDPETRRGIRARAQQGADLLKSLGVRDRTWLEAGPQDRRIAEQSTIGKIVSRAHRFAGSVSARAGRPGLAPNLAAAKAYKDDVGRSSSIGAALVKSLGIYPPGSLVLMSTGELAIVVKRGPEAHLPGVAIIRDASGRVFSQPVRWVPTSKGAIRASLPMVASPIRVEADQLIELTC